jgi:hypothetical protein
VPAAAASPENFALVIVTPGPTSIAASAAALLLVATLPIFATTFSPRGAGGGRNCASASIHGSNATANATIRRRLHVMVFSLGALQRLRIVSLYVRYDNGIDRQKTSEY